MKRINTPTASSGKFVDGNPSIGRKATQLSAEWCNNIQEELCNAIHALTGADPTGVVSMDELGAALAGVVGKVKAGNVDSLGYLGNKFLGNVESNTGDVYFNVIEISGNKKIVAFVKNASIGVNKLASKSVTLNQLDDNLRRAVVGATVEDYVSVAQSDTSKKIAEITTETGSRIVDITVSCQLVNGEVSPAGRWDFELVVECRNSGAQPVEIAAKRLTWGDKDTVTARFCFFDTYSIGASLRILAKKTSQGNYWSGSPETFDIRSITVDGVLP